MTADIVIEKDASVTIGLPGLTGIMIDTAARLIAVDNISGAAHGEPLRPGYVVRDLRDGVYGDFHRLTPAASCFDPVCAASGEHDTDPGTAAGQMAAVREVLARALGSEHGNSQLALEEIGRILSGDDS